MTLPGKARGQILILLATWLFFGGGASSALVVYERPVSAMKKGVEQVVTDGSRKDAILSDISRWESLQEQHSEQVNEHREQLFKALRRKDTPRSELEPIMAQLDKTFVVMDWDFLNLRFRVTEQVTRVEWSQIVPRPERPASLGATDHAIAHECRLATSSGCNQHGGL